MAVAMTAREDVTLAKEPASRPGHIDTLVKGVDRYNPSNCHLLEDYLKDQLSNDTYDPFANLALLKLYQFNPSLLSPQAAISVLFLALVNAPFQPDFLLAWSLLSDSFVTGAPLPPAESGFDDDEMDSQHDEEDDDAAEERRRRRQEPAQDQGERATAEHLKELNAALQMREMTRAWKDLRGAAGAADVERVLGQVKQSAPNWTDRLRNSIADELERSFASLPASAISKFLGLDNAAAAVQEWSQKRGWSQEGDSVKLSKVAKQQPQPTATGSAATGSQQQQQQQQRLGIDQMSSLMSARA